MEPVTPDLSGRAPGDPSLAPPGPRSMMGLPLLRSGRRHWPPEAPCPVSGLFAEMSSHYLHPCFSPGGCSPLSVLSVFRVHFVVVKHTEYVCV